MYRVSLDFFQKHHHTQPVYEFLRFCGNLFLPKDNPLCTSTYMSNFENKGRWVENIYRAYQWITPHNPHPLPRPPFPLTTVAVHPSHASQSCPRALILSPLFYLVTRLIYRALHKNLIGSPGKFHNNLFSLYLCVGGWVNRVGRCVCVSQSVILTIPEN